MEYSGVKNEEVACIVTKVMAHDAARAFRCNPLNQPTEYPHGQVDQ